ncbi:MAG TPA: nitrate/nitrite transporter NrtS [Chthoniobacterales bacterium]|nr:nitrate/nitrite transporter NrtS [Chthoniobacterales bacterium]
MKRVRPWLEEAARPSVVRRATMTAIVVGVILVAINHGPAIVNGQVTAGRIVQMCLTFAVPYLVSTTSSVAAARERR